MQLWQLDIVGGVWLVDTTTGVLREAKVVTGVDDHSRYLRDRVGRGAGHGPSRVSGIGGGAGPVRGAGGDPH